MSMQNFRSANLVTGSPLGAVDFTVNLTADNQFVMTQGLSLIRLYSDNTTATNRTFTIQSGVNATMDPGGNNLLTLIFEAGSSYTCQLVNTGNVKLTADWTPIQYQSLVLRWDGQYWIEVSRAPGSIASTSLTSAHIFVGNGSNVATDVAMSGDATLANTGAITIANSAITNAKVSASAAIDYSKLATLTSGNILVGSAGGVATSVAMSGDATIVASGALTIAPAIYRKTNVSLTQANIIAMGVTPVEILPAASAGTYYLIDSVELIHTYSTAAYTGGGDVQLQYDSGAVAVVLFADTVVTAASSGQWVIKPTIYDLDASTGTGQGFATAGAVAKSVTITNAGGAFAAGNAANIIKVSVTYRVVTALT